LLFSFSLAMNKFLIGRVVTAIDYTLIQFSIRLAVATTLTTRLSSLFMAVLPWQHSITEDAPLHASAQLDFRIGSPKSESACLMWRQILSSEKAFVARIETKVSIDTIVQ